MNTKLIKKCIDELDAEKPRLDYLKGILETLYEIESSATTISGTTTFPIPPYYVNSSVTNTGTQTGTGKISEPEILDYRVWTPIDEIKKLTDESTN